MRGLEPKLSKYLTVKYIKNRSAMRTWGLMLSFIPFGWNDVLKYQYLGMELLQVRRSTSR